MGNYSERVQSLLQAMTLEEKVSLLAGASSWHTPAIERLGIPALKVTDGPNGARGAGSFGTATPTTCYPCGIALAATWNTALVEQVGQALGEETKAKGAQVLLAPTVNIQRSPLNGRNFECYSEDPYLAARIAVAYIQGVQSRGVGVSVKHYAGNNSEFERLTISSEIAERALREIYLPAFEAAVREAGAWTVMASYNKVNGTYASENAELLTSILKQEWGFDGVVISDWVATHSTVAALDAGLDLEMPGPTRWRGDKLVQAVHNGEVSAAAVDDAAARMLHLIERSGLLDSPPSIEERSDDSPARRALVRQAAAEGIVLLKNNGVLPLDASKLRKVAIIGPNAKQARIMGGGSAQVNALYTITPYDGLTAQLEPTVEVGYEMGCANHRFIPPLDITQVAPAADQQHGGFAVAYYNSLDLSGEPVWQTTLASSDIRFNGELPPTVDPAAFSFRASGYLTPTVSGLYTFGLVSAGLSRLMVDGQQVIDNWSAQTAGDSYMGMGSAEQRASLMLTAGKPVALALEYSKPTAGGLAGVRFGALPPLAEDAIARAVNLAASADVALIFVGSSGEWESEGADRPDLDLVGEQDDLIKAVSTVNPNTVVVIQTGSPIVMPWLDGAAAALQAWFCGQECGNAIADVLFGKVDASGRLPQTFPMRLQDNPAYINYPGEHGKVHYGEGIFVGYRYYDKKDIAPLFPFGFGLSYTDFAYANLRLSQTQLAAGESLVVTVDVTNSGQRAGAEVVQLYVRDVKASVMRPPKELKGFAKIALQPGEIQTVSFSLDPRALSYYDDLAHRWVAEAGEFQALVGRSSQDIRLTASFQLLELA